MAKETKAEEHREEEKKKREHRKRGGHVGHRKRARGGKAEAAPGEKHEKAQEYNAQGSAAMRSATETKDDGFKKGGHVKKHHHLKHGGHVEGEKEHERLDKRARGGHVGHKHRHHAMARGGSAMSSGHHLSHAMNMKGDGHEGERVGETD
jgi:hypothetical protein